MKFRKRPIVIEAVQYRHGMKHVALRPAYDHMNGSNPVGEGIQTLEGYKPLNPGDWIIRGVKGEYYPCRPDIFALTYEKVIKKRNPRPNPTAVKDFK